MEQKLQIWIAVLFLGLAASAQNSSVSVTCGSSHLLITVPVDLFGNGVPIDADELILGSGCAVTSADLQTLQLEYPLAACGAIRRLLPSNIHYRNVLYYIPSATNGVIRTSPFSHPIDCFYQRSWNVSSLGLLPTWVPFSSTLLDTQNLDFVLEVFDSMWSQPVADPIYYLGDLINIQASVRQGSHVPLKIYLDECVARPSAEFSVKYEVITNHGCLVDGQHSRSRFLATQDHNVIRLQLDTFTFIGATNNQIYLICHLKAVSAGSVDTLHKACSFDRTTASWNSHEGGDCSCCASQTGCGSKRRKRQQPKQGLSGEADLKVGPITLIESEGDLLMMNVANTSKLMTAVTGAASLEIPHAVILPHDQGVNTIVLQGEAKDTTTNSTSGFHLPFSTATLVIVIACVFIVCLAILGCYCSVKRSHRGYHMEVVSAALGETGAVVMAPAAVGTSGTRFPGDSRAPSKKAGVSVTTTSGESAYV